MSVSSISSTQAPLPFNYLDTNTQAAPAATADNSNDASDSSNDASSAQPPAPPPLPPGQGTRVNQLV
ncbi:hypothetical protein [Bradyrhizobium sp.]|uniref:hypothetical protein n=1 Tax=Bradyrhizobium sp. TaxID=376 RepID=UPI00262759EA|nr:hypothetical protein [Bradyrhizobium sp.]